MGINYLDLINVVDNVPQDFVFNDLYKFLLPDDPRPHGFILPEIVKQIPWTPEFLISGESKTVQLSCPPATESCNAAIQSLVDLLIDRKIFSNIHNDRHSEMNKILGARFDVQIERFPKSLFGIASRGAHLTGYTMTSSGEMKFWIPRRSPHLFTYPNKLDTTVAGGVKASQSPFSCVVDESDEEASLDRAYVTEHAKSVGVLTYVTVSERRGGLYQSDVLYVYDLEMPPDMVPKPNDDEVAEFVLMGIEEVKMAMQGGEFKDNCNLVMIDFFIRHGILTPENERDYVEICQRLHRRLPVPIAG
ncbi:hypothetical protein EJ08DRAFT_700237 [Tothia fuscella]|uniref:Nudix hydrolase domain-containing protein n=1 Tax=Tothia fuscella TaxID=1048955 RepID=A0A9P4NKU7_9PEZI|nr:hypothetical protein EJ08DRAFT_700237 [Tothia fuscella]